MTTPAELGVVLAKGDDRLVPLSDNHIAALREVCFEDRDIWEIYPHSMLDEHFDASLASRKAVPGAIFAAFWGDELVGMTSYLRPDPANGVVEIGGTYIAPRMRGTGYNRVIKKLMIDHAFDSGYRRIVFLVDERNKRSQAAVLKLGALREGLLRQDRVTWTGYLRNTCVFGLLAGEWRG